MIHLSEAQAQMCFSSFVEGSGATEAYRLMRGAIKTSAMDPRTGKVDMLLLTTGTFSGTQKLKEDMHRAVVVLLDEMGMLGRVRRGVRGVKWSEGVRDLGGQSSVIVDVAEFGEVRRAFEGKGVVRISGGFGERGVERRVVEG